MTKHKLALVIKLAQKLSDEELMKMASDKLSLEEIEKVALVEGLDALFSGVKNVGKAMGAAIPGAGVEAPFAHMKAGLGGVGEALSGLGATAMANKPAAALAGGAGLLGTMATAYLAHKALKGMFGGDEDDTNERLASAKAELPAELRARLDKLAEDPGVAAACYTLIQHGVI